MLPETHMTPAHVKYETRDNVTLPTLYTAAVNSSQTTQPGGYITGSIFCIAATTSQF